MFFKIIRQLSFIRKYTRIDYKVLIIGENNIKVYTRELFDLEIDYKDILTCDIENNIEVLFTGPYIKNRVVIKTTKKLPNQKHEIIISEIDLKTSSFDEINKLINDKIINNKEKLKTSTII